VESATLSGTGIMKKPFEVRREPNR
jgi:hypothetical protein